MGRDYGYPRVSTPKQKIERQIRNIQEQYPNAILYPEVWSGTTVQRREWQKLLKRVQPGDRIIFDSVSRMSRNAEEGFADYERLFYQGVELVFLKEPHINTSVFRQVLERKISLTGTNIDYILDGVNKYLMELAREQIRLAFEQAEKEVTDLHQRTKEGLQTARNNGKVIGRPGGRSYETKKSKQAKADIIKMSKEFGGTMKDTDIIRLLGINRNTYYKYKRDLRDTILSKPPED